jgi:hypothetical protein
MTFPMRGSPLLRTLVLLLLLIVAGSALVRLTRPLSGPGTTHPTAPADDPIGSADPGTVLRIPFEITLSAPPSLLQIAEPAGQVLFESNQGDTRQSGILELPHTPAALFLQVRWATATIAPRFAKLSLEPPGRPTLSHIFDAPAEIDDAWELPAGALAPPADD